MNISDLISSRYLSKALNSGAELFINAGRKQGNQPSVKFLPVHIKVESLIQPFQVIGQINGPYGKKLRVNQNIFRQA
jgi:hypothetical protein